VQLGSVIVNREKLFYMGFPVGDNARISKVLLYSHTSCYSLVS